MNKTRLLIISMLLTLSVATVIAEPVISTDCCKPEPVGGFNVLKSNTIYPAWAQEEKMNSEVLLNFNVDINGNVSDISVAKSGGALFDQSAIDAVLNTKWSPAMQEGTPVAVNYQQPFEYRTR